LVHPSKNRLLAIRSAEVSKDSTLVPLGRSKAAKSRFFRGFSGADCSACPIRVVFFGWRFRHFCNRFGSVGHHTACGVGLGGQQASLNPRRGRYSTKARTGTPA